MRFSDDESIKKKIYLFLSIALIILLAFGVLLLWYNNKLIEETEIGVLNVDYNKVSSNTNVAQVSFSKDKNIKDIEENKVNTKEVEKVASEEKSDNKKESTNSVETVSKDTAKEEPKKTVLSEEEFEGEEIEIGEYIFEYEAPIAGEIIKDFTEENLVYSKTLDEWTTHLGIDIKADKTAVVKAAEKGVVENIKNDPRYGLTIIIAHDDGCKTVYSNLLSSEFVSIGEMVEKGQAIGTVGQSASFESADDSHLHFEMYKDGKNVNPTIYFK